MKTIILSILFLTVNFSFAAEIEPFSFKEIPLNSHYEFLNNYSAFQCVEISGQTFADKQCTYTNTPYKNATDQRLNTFGGVDIREITLQYLNDKLKNVLVIFVPQSFDQVVGALRSKYGPPSEEKNSEFKTKGGAKYENNSYRWRQGKSSLAAEKYFGDMKTSLVQYKMDDYYPEVDRRSREKAKQGASDL